MGAVESSQCANYDVLQKDSSFCSPFEWELHHAKSKLDGSLVSIFRSSTKNECTSNALKKIRMFRHPCILKYIEGNEADTGVFYATELAIPLSEWLEYAKGKKTRNESDPLYAFLPTALDNDQLVSWCMWGLSNILKALKFLNEDAKQVHGLIHPTSIFVTQAGSWKLGCFDLTYDFKPKEEPPFFYVDKQQMLPSDYRSPERTQNNYSLIGDCVVWSQDMYSFGQLMDYIFTGLNIPSQLNNYAMRCKSAPLGRPAPSRLITTFSKHPLVKSLNFLEEKAIKDPMQKEAFFNQLNKSLKKFPSVITVGFILPLLMDELIHGQTEFAPIVLPSVIIIGSNLPSERFAKEISPLITQLFERKDRATRLQLLKNLENYIQYIDKRVINDHIFPQVIIGFGDTSANMKEATIRTMIPLSKYLTVANQGKMIQSMSVLQEDPLPALRTNVLVCLNKIVDDLDADIRRQYAFPCIGKGLRDPFPKARIQSLKTIKATEHYFDDGLLARKIMPSLCPLLWDVETTVREAAFDVIQSILNTVYAGHLEWTKSGVEPKVHTEVKTTSVMNAAGSYMNTAMSWVTGGFMKKAEPEKKEEATPTAISSSNVNKIMPAIPNIEITNEDLEAMSKKEKPESTSSLQRMDSMNEDIWGSNDVTPKKDEINWNKDEWNEPTTEKKEKTEVKDEIKEMGGWGDVDLSFSDEEDEEKKKEDANLELIRQMTEAKNKPEPEPTPVKKESRSRNNTLNLRSSKPVKAAPMDLDDWADSLLNEGKEKKNTSRTNRASRRSAKKVTTDLFGDDDNKQKSSNGWGDDDDLFGDDDKKTSNNGWGDDDDLFGDDDKKKTSNNGWDDDDDWGSKPTKQTSKNNGWDDDDDWGSKPTKKTVKKDDWDDDDWGTTPTKKTVKKDDWDDDDWGTTTKKTVNKKDDWDDW